MGIWLALGLISLASCAPQSPQVPAQNSPTSVGSSAPSTPPADVHFAPNAPIDSANSAALTNQLHGSQLPLVGARVLAATGGPHQAILYGFVRTPFGKADAADKTRQWLNDPEAQIDNRIKVEPDLAATPGGSPSAPMASNSDINNPDLQTYQNQQKIDNQALNQQQQAYMNQGSPFSGGGLGGSGILMMLPLLMGGFGGGGSSFSFGGGGFGSPYGSSYGSPYGPSYPSPSYPSPGGSPYGP